MNLRLQQKSLDLPELVLVRFALRLARKLYPFYSTNECFQQNLGLQNPLRNLR